MADQGPGRGMGFCAVKGHLWAGAREEGRSPSQGLAKFSDSDTSGWYVPYPVQSTTNRYVPMGMYLGTPFRYVPVHVPPCRPCTMYLFGFESREQQQRPTIHPSIPSYAIPHPPMPCLGQCDLPRQLWMLAIKRAKHSMRRDEKHRSFSPMCVWSVRPPAERAHARYLNCLFKASIYMTASDFRLTLCRSMRKRPWLRLRLRHRHKAP